MQLKQLPMWFGSQIAYHTLSSGSQEQYSILLRQGVEGLGADKDIREIRAPEADALYQALKESGSEHKAIAVCKVCRRVWNVAMRHELTDINPFAAMGLGDTPRRQVLWTEGQLNTFIGAAVAFGLPSLGLLAVLCYTFAQRPGDMRKLKWEDYHDHAIHFTQEKTGKVMVIAVPPHVAYELDEVPKLGPYIVTREDTLRPYTEDDYNKLFRIVRKRALLPDHLQLRDLRRTGITEHAASGATDSELMSVSGHDTRNTLNIYTVINLAMSRAAMEKRFDKKVK